MLPILLSPLPQVAAPHGLGLEWLPIVSIVLPFFVLVGLMLAGRNRV